MTSPEKNYKKSQETQWRVLRKPSWASFDMETYDTISVMGFYEGRSDGVVIALPVEDEEASISMAKQMIGETIWQSQ